LAYNLAVEFVWDVAKSEANQRKHGVSFREAQELFESGVDYLEIFDSAHSTDEDRFVAIGPISRGIVVVIWTEPVEDTVRIISARMATQRDRELFQARMKEF
jgi:uncharacterized DUF497 family protein